MGKIFEFSGGSFIDKVSGSVGANTNGSIERTEKGTAWMGNGADSKLDYATILQDKITDTGPFTGEAWFRTKDVVTPQAVWGLANAAGDRFVLIIESGEVRWGELGGDEDSSTSINPSQWYHAMFTYDNGVSTLYLDGVLQTGTTAPSVFYSGIRFIIGTSPSPGSLILDGDVGRVQFYDHILTAEERAKHYQEFLHSTPITKTIR